MSAGRGARDSLPSLPARPAVASGTSSGWIDPRAASALEFVSQGDVATVSMQYSYLPSWLSFLVDQERTQSNAAELITAIRVELDSLPPDERPEPYVYGDSPKVLFRPPGHRGIRPRDGEGCQPARLGLPWRLP